MGLLTEFDAIWNELREMLGVSEANAAQMKAKVLACYGEPGRAYHNLSHMMQVWDDAKKYALEEGIEDTGTVQMAALLHDVVYDTKRQDNETRSAEFAVYWGQKLGIRSSAIEQAAEIILATQQHGPTDSVEIGVVLDADLAILAASPAEYNAYRDAIRQEYAWVTEADWTVGRGRVLSAFLDREQIYHRASVRNRLEAAARENVARELSLLAK